MEDSSGRHGHPEAAPTQPCMSDTTEDTPVSAPIEQVVIQKVPKPRSQAQMEALKNAQKRAYTMRAERAALQAECHNPSPG